MAVRWRELLEHLRVPWTDKSRYAGRGWIAIRCPWCGDADPATHLGINQESGGYNCFRSSEHSGRSSYWLLLALGVARREMDELLKEYGYTGPARRPERPPPVPTGPFARRWETFRPAHTDDEACGYLTERGFWRPAATARTFDLRIGTGKWAARLWFPLAYNDEVLGFTGRSMRRHAPRYMTESADTVLYLPRALHVEDKILIIVEGPIDALRLADFAQDRYNIAVAALCGLAVSESKRLQLLAIARAIPQFFVVMDSTVSPVKANRAVAELRMCLSDFDAPDRPQPTVRRLELLPGVADPGEMQGEEIELWLRQTGLAEMAR